MIECHVNKYHMFNVIVLALSKCIDHTTDLTFLSDQHCESLMDHCDLYIAYLICYIFSPTKGSLRIKFAKISLKKKQLSFQIKSPKKLSSTVNSSLSSHFNGINSSVIDVFCHLYVFLYTFRLEWKNIFWQNNFNESNAKNAIALNNLSKTVTRMILCLFSLSLTSFSIWPVIFLCLSCLSRCLFLTFSLGLLLHLSYNSTIDVPMSTEAMPSSSLFRPLCFASIPLHLFIPSHSHPFQFF